MAAQVENKLGGNIQERTKQPERSLAQPIPPAVSFMEVVHEAPRLMELMTPECLKALTATCTQLRRDFRHRVTTITMTNEQDQAMLFADKWPRLVMVVISNAFSLEERLTTLRERLTTRKVGVKFTPYLSKREWATIMHIRVEEDDVIEFESSFNQSEAFVVRARHQSSQDMNIKTYGVALARLATKCETKARRLSLTSQSADLNPFKHLHMSGWPCLKRIDCFGECGNKLPVCCFWGGHLPNLQNVYMVHCRLGADIVQPLVSTCPHLCNLTLTECKVDATALACLSQASFSRLGYLSINTTPQGCHNISMRKKPAFPLFS